MKLAIAQLGQPVLWEKAEEIHPEEIFSDPVRDLLRDMHETLIAHRGAGLAAPQVFSGKRLFLAAIWPPAKEGEMSGIEVFINPRIVGVSEETGRAWEGCLSFPELLVQVERHRAVRVEYLNGQGEARSLDLVDFPARVIQHEYDHLEGILTLDRAMSSRQIIKASEIDTVLGKKVKTDEDEM